MMTLREAAERLTLSRRTLGRLIAAKPPPSGQARAWEGFSLRPYLRARQNRDAHSALWHDCGGMAKSA